MKVEVRQKLLVQPYWAMSRARLRWTPQAMAQHELSRCLGLRPRSPRAGAHNGTGSNPRAAWRSQAESVEAKAGVPAAPTLKTRQTSACAVQRPYTELPSSGTRT